MRALIWLTLVILYIFSIINQLGWLNFLVLVFLNIYVILELRSDNSEFTQKVVALEEKIRIIQARLKSIEEKI
ncbi:MAG TPA: hypothetical protein DCY91_17860 [Cyanobacteria bacterium UBA11370]|nr:hypothetical protein [Cyanobacteria bacterium UBA11370]HBY79345.1 hypothetical protein [Cyanobacteria bacterium UBA11148]